MIRCRVILPLRGAPPGPRHRADPAEAERKTTSRTHDVVADPPPAPPGGFDLAHARLVLMHIADRAEASAPTRRVAGRG
ncbi:hypothetical protein C9F11_39340 [Streptomyces sp. YIM 121038]|nr:hypothetical protein C9F11_39340 [Streptomyces sp. YIM 121038]